MTDTIREAAQAVVRAFDEGSWCRFEVEQLRTALAEPGCDLASSSTEKPHIAVGHCLTNAQKCATILYIKDIKKTL